MSKITRYTGNLKAFASEATGTERTIFGDTAQSDSLDANITLDLLRGWGVIGVESNPTKQHFNGLGFTLGQLIAYLHQQGVPEWNAAQEYYAGSVVTTLAGIYRLKSGGDGSYDPDTEGGVNWELIPTQAKVDAKADQATTYTETEVNNLLDDKADKATTYTETEVNNLLDAKADQATTYTETEVDGLLNAKADQATTYTETEVDDLLDDKAAISGQTFSGDVSAPNLSGTNTGDGALAIGVGQTWQDVTSSRSSGVTYTNSTSKPITAAVSVRDSGGGDPANAFVGATRVIYNYNVDDHGESFTFIIPAGSTYRCDYGANPLQSWVELR